MLALNFTPRVGIHQRVMLLLNEYQLPTPARPGPTVSMCPSCHSFRRTPPWRAAALTVVDVAAANYLVRVQWTGPRARSTRDPIPSILLFEPAGYHRMSVPPSLSWFDANQRYLTLSLKRLRFLLESRLQADTPPPTAPDTSELEDLAASMQTPPALVTLRNIFGLRRSSETCCCCAPGSNWIRSSRPCSTGRPPPPSAWRFPCFRKPTGAP